MKKMSKAALAAAFILTLSAGFSAQAADLHVNDEGVATGAEVAASLQDQNVNLHDVTVSSIQTNNGAQLNGGANIHNGANVYVKPGDENALTVNGGGFVVNKLAEDENGNPVPGETVYKVDGEGNITGNSAEIKGNINTDTIEATNGGTIGNVTMVNGTINSYDAQGNRDLYYDGEGNLYADGTVTGKTGKFDSITVGDILNGGTGTQINEDGSITTTGPITASQVNAGEIFGADGKFHVDETGDILMQNQQGESLSMTDNGIGIVTSGSQGAGTITAEDGAINIGANKADGSILQSTNVGFGADGVTITTSTDNYEEGIHSKETTTITGNGISTGSLTANGGATLNGGTTMNGGATVNGGLTADTAHVTGSTAIDGTLAVGQSANINGGLAVNGGAAINGGLTVDGTDVMGSIADNADKIAQNTTAIANNSSRINALNSRVSDLGNEIDNVGAISSALAGLHPLDYDGTGSKFQLAAAMGNYDGTQAAAIGGFYHFNEDIMMSVGGATSFGGDNKSAFNVGVSFRVGQGSSGKRVSNDEVLAQLTAMNDKIAALEAENQQLSEKVAALEGGEGAEAAEAE